MGRPKRVDAGGYVYHVPNRGNGRMTVFEDADDYAAFERVLEEAAARYPGVRILAYCLMPNHWHLVLHPAKAGALSRFVGWLTLTHTQRWHAHRHTTGGGHVYQGRYKSFLIGRELPRRRLPVRRAQPAAGGPGDRGRALAVVQPLAVVTRRRRGQGVALALAGARRASAQELDRQGQSAAEQGRVRGDPAGHHAWPPAGLGCMAGAGQRSVRARIHLPPARPAAQTEGIS